MGHQSVAQTRPSKVFRPHRQEATGESDVNAKRLSLSLAAAALFSIMAAPAFSQAPAGTVSRTTKAVNYRRAGGSTRIFFSGTELMQSASGEAKVEGNRSRMEIDDKLGKFEE